MTNGSCKLQQRDSRILCCQDTHIKEQKIKRILAAKKTANADQRHANPHSSESFFVYP